MLILALESSTSSSKAMLFDTDIGVVGMQSQQYDSSFCNDGLTNTDDVFHLTIDIGRRLSENKKIDAIALCGTWHSMAVCDKEMNPVLPTYGWNFMEPSELCKQERQNKQLTSLLYTHTGCMPHVTYARQTLKYLQEKNVNLKDKLFPSQGCYNLYKLTGCFVESASTMSGSGLLNINSLKYDDFALDYAGIKCDQLGRLVNYKDICTLNESGAKLLGVKSGIPVVPAHPDGALNQIASHAAQVGNMTMSIGTSAAIRLTTNHPVLPEGQELWCYYGVEDWVSGAAVSNACNCINWYKETYLLNQCFSELDREIDPIQSTPVFLPFIFGERCPGWRDDRLGGFVDVSPKHGPIEFYRSIQAGIIYNLLQCYEVLCKNNSEPDKIYLSGGVLNSKQWTQMVADIFMHEIICVKNFNSSLTGAAVLGAYALGAIDDIRNYTGDIKDANVFSPREQYSEYYKQQYDRYLYWYDITNT